MRPIRVMHILSDLHTGGAQRVVCDIVCNLDRTRFAPHVCTLREGGELIGTLDEHRVPHHMSYFSSRLSLPGLLRLRGLLQELEIDIVHTHLRRSNLSGRLAAVLAGTPVIIAHAHDTLSDSRKLHRFINRRLQKKTAHFFCVSDAVAEAQAKLQGLDEKHFTTLYNFIDPERYHSDISPQLAKADIGVPVESPCVGIVGRLHPLKRHDIFLDAAFQLNQRRPDVHFAVIGDGKLRDKLRDRARQLGMAHKITFTGNAHDMARVYRALDCVALCSDSEGLGMVLLEAQAAGVPVVARAVGGVREVLSGGGGLLVEEASPTAFARAFEEALKPATARMLRTQMPDNLRRFSAARQITTLEDIYEDSFAECIGDSSF